MHTKGSGHGKLVQLVFVNCQNSISEFLLSVSIANFAFYSASTPVFKAA